jgi:hypothetical protein
MSSEIERAVFKPLHWDHYQEVNALFAAVVAAECGQERAVVWVQDYHLALCPALLRQCLPHLPIMHFWHIPWPPGKFTVSAPGDMRCSPVYWATISWVSPRTALPEFPGMR